METYAKVFNSILDSTIWDEDDATRILWITLLVKSDKHGEVMASVPGLAKAARLTNQQVVNSLKRLMEPDPWSRTKDENEGRRIAEIDRGWLILNYVEHAARMSADDQRRKANERKKRWREKRRETEERSANVDKRGHDGTSRDKSTEERHIDIDGDRDISFPTETKKGAVAPSVVVDQEFALVIDEPKKPKPKKPKSIGQATLEECEFYAQQFGASKEQGALFFDKMSANGWKSRTGALKCWKAAFRNYFKSGWLAVAPGSEQAPKGSVAANNPVEPDYGEPGTWKAAKYPSKKRQ